jgi:hypothetical protein
MIPLQADTEHSLFSASSADRWSVCPSSLKADAETQDRSSKAAAEGTVAHAIAANILEGRAEPEVGTVIEEDHHKIEYSEDMQNDVWAYVKYVQGLPWVGGYAVESRVYYNRSLAVARNLAFGTCDVRGWTQDAEGTMLEIVDLKFGRKAVKAVGNPQMSLYAVGVIEDMAYGGMPLPRDQRVRMTIYQPRVSYKPITWETTVGRVEDFALSLRPAALAAKAYLTQTDTEQTRTDFPELPGKHCLYCERKAKCEAFNRVVTGVTHEGKTVVWNPTLFKLKDAITGYLDELESLALDAALAGAPLEGTKLVKGRAGKSELLLPEAEIRAKATTLGIEDKVVQLKEVWLTPAKIRDAFKKAGMPTSEVQTIVRTPEGKPCITTDDDPREAYVSSDTHGFVGQPVII